MGSTVWSMSKEEKEKLIASLAPELVVLRAKAGISQEELSDLIGVSRQTYSAIERGVKQMSWSTFLSLVLFYNCNRKTHKVLRSIQAIPQEIMLAFNVGNTEKDVNLDLFLGDGTNAIVESLDAQAMRSIRTMIMLEYARCTSTPGEVIVKSFDGMNFNVPVAPKAKTKEAHRAIKEIKQTHEK